MKYKLNVGITFSSGELSFNASKGVLEFIALIPEFIKRMMLIHGSDFSSFGCLSLYASMADATDVLKN